MKLIWALLLLAALSAAAGIAVYYQQSRTILAVLPLDNLSADPQQAYLADALTAELIDSLGQLDPGRLRVLGRRTAMHYKFSPKAPAQIAHELGAAYLLVGGAERSGQHLRVSLRLIPTGDEKQAWSHNFDREFSAAPTLETDIASALAEQLHLSAPSPRASQSSPLNPAAYDAYLQGLQALNTETPDGSNKAVVRLQNAAQLDPNFASAFAQLSRAYALASLIATIPPAEAAPKALDAATQAIRLDNTLAIPHTVIGLVKARLQHDWPAAAREFESGVQLAPNNPDTHLLYSTSYLSPLRHSKEAIAEIQKAIDIDPFSSFVHSLAGKTYLWAAKEDRAMDEYNHADEIDQASAMNHERVAHLNAMLNKFDQASHEETTARVLNGEKPQDVLKTMNIVWEAAVSSGAPGYWRAQLQISQAAPPPPPDYARDFALAIIYTHLGQNSQALASLENAWRAHDPQLIELAAEPQFEPLRKDPRFVDLEKRLGLPTQ